MTSYTRTAEEAALMAALAEDEKRLEKVLSGFRPDELRRLAIAAARVAERSADLAAEADRG